MTIAESKHQKMLERISRNPKLIGLEDVIWAEIEVPVHNTKGGKRLLTAIDVLLYNGTYNVIEYKCTGVNRKKARHQLLLAKEYIRRTYNDDAVMYFAYGTKPDYEIF